MIKLGINVDHVATLRQARGGVFPDPVAAALAAEMAGADAITVHLREDRRHIQERDVQILLATAQTRVNLEMAPTQAMVAWAVTHLPADCCLVPEKREELTTEGGLDVAGHLELVSQVTKQLTDAGIRVSLFIDAEERQIEAAHQTGAPVIELHTGKYAEARDATVWRQELDLLRQGAKMAQNLGLTVHAGHGLNYHNVQEVAAITGIRELNIGHAVIGQALFSGMAGAVFEMKRLMRTAVCAGSS